MKSPPLAGVLPAGESGIWRHSGPAGLPTREAAAGPGSTQQARDMDNAPADEQTPMASAVGEEAALLAARLRSHSATSPRPPHSPRPPGGDHVGPWAWLTPAGLGAGEAAELQVPRRAIPNLVGRGGRMIDLIEDLMGVILGVGDGEGETVTVTVFGPKDRLDWACQVILCVAKGARSLIRRLTNAHMEFRC